MKSSTHKTIKTYIVCDYNLGNAFTSMSRRDFELYMGEFYPEYYLPRANTLEGLHEGVEVVFIDDVDAERYELEEGNYDTVSEFLACSGSV